MFLKACLNGRRSTTEHAALPITPAALAFEGARAIGAGADALHIHVRGVRGEESLRAEDVAACLETMRAACAAVPIGISSGIWIEPEPLRRLELVAGWDEVPDFVSVNMSEPGAVELCARLLDRGIGVEPGLATSHDVAVLAGSGLAASALRILIEPAEGTAAAALATVNDIVAALDAGGLHGPRLLHGADDSFWPVFDHAVRLGYQSRVGFEDSLTLPDGSPAESNEFLVRAAREREAAAGRGRAEPGRPEVGR